MKLLVLIAHEVRVDEVLCAPVCPQLRSYVEENRSECVLFERPLVRLEKRALRCTACLERAKPTS